MTTLERYEMYLWLGMPPLPGLVRLNRVFGKENETGQPTLRSMYGPPSVVSMVAGKSAEELLQDAIYQRYWRRRPV